MGKKISKSAEQGIVNLQFSRELDERLKRCYSHLNTSMARVHQACADACDAREREAADDPEPDQPAECERVTQGVA